MAVLATGKPAVTHYRLTERFRGHTLVRVQLETGRTHQIHVHMTHIRDPLIGDRTYARLRLPAGATAPVRQTLQKLPRQALHARRLGLIHPVSGEEMLFESAVPTAMEALLTALRQDRGTE